MRRQAFVVGTVAAATLVAAVAAVVLRTADPEPRRDSRAVPAGESATPAPAQATGPAPGSVGARTQRLREVRPSGGVLVIRTETADLRDVRIRGGVDFYGRELRLDNVVVEGGHGWWGLLVTRRTDSTVYVTDTTIRSVRPLAKADGIQPLGGGRVVARRVDISGGVDGVKPGPGSVVESSWIHDLTTAPGTHNDGIQLTGGTGIVVRRNRIEVNAAAELDPAHHNAAIFLQSLGGPLRDVVIEGNYLLGGGYTLRIEGDARDVVVRDNVFGPVGTTVPWAAHAYVSPQSPAPAWSNNRRAPDGRPVAAPSAGTAGSSSTG